MGLLPAQLTALKADIAANTNTIPAGQPWSGAFATMQVNAVPNSGDGNAAIAGWYDQFTATYNVFRSDVTTKEIFDQVTWANYTPQDAIAADGSNAALWTARSMACQGKQFNLQILLQGQQSFDAGRPTQRGGLNDATTALPSGAAGASKSGGWATILPILRRLARNIEKLFSVKSTGVGTDGQDATRGQTGNPDTLVFEGTITGSDVEQARNLP